MDATTNISRSAVGNTWFGFAIRVGPSVRDRVVSAREAHQIDHKP
jgi:hypothetical protein